MKISAHVSNSHGRNDVGLRTDDTLHSLDIPPKPTGFGSSVNGGELLFLALATCYCNDLYREAARRSIPVRRVDVGVEGDFGEEGEPAKNVKYAVRVFAAASKEDIEALIRGTDKTAEVQNTLRIETPVTLGRIEVINS